MVDVSDSDDDDDNDDSLALDGKLHLSTDSFGTLMYEKSGAS